jgi:hypothetical protein
MARIKVSKHYREKKSDGTFGDRIYFGTYANFVTVRRPGSNDNYEDLQTTLDNFETKVKNTITWKSFSEY